MVLLLRVEVAQLSLPLSRHPPLGLNHLLCLARAAGGLVALSSVEVLKVRIGMGARIFELVNRMRSGNGADGHTSIWSECQWMEMFH